MQEKLSEQICNLEQYTDLIHCVKAAIFRGDAGGVMADNALGIAVDGLSQIIDHLKTLAGGEDHEQG